MVYRTRTGPKAIVCRQKVQHGLIYWALPVRALREGSDFQLFTWGSVTKCGRCIVVVMKQLKIRWKNSTFACLLQILPARLGSGAYFWGELRWAPVSRGNLERFGANIWLGAEIATSVRVTQFETIDGWTWSTLIYLSRSFLETSSRNIGYMSVKEELDIDLHRETP